MADMNVTAARPGLTPIQWSSDFWVEYLRENQFSVYFGTSMDAMIQLQTDLTRKPGDTVVFPTVRNLVGAGVTRPFQILQCSDAPRAPVVVPERMMPKAARERVASPPAGTATPPRARACRP